MWRRILALMVKEFQALLRDRKSRFVLIGPPLVQLFVFSYAATYDITEVPYAVFDEDGGSAARELVARIEGSPHFRLRERIDHIDRIEELVDSREVLLVLHIGPQFGRRLALGQPAPLQVIIDGRNSNTAMIVLNYVRAVVTRFNLNWIETHGGRPPPARMEVRAWFNPNLESRWFIVPGIVGLLTLLVTLLVTALSVAREREHGTFDQLLVTPMRPVEILLGKALPGLVVGFVEGTFITLMAVLWFDIPFVGHPAVLYAGLAVFLLSATGVGIMISSVAVTQQQGLLGAFLFMVPAVILSGFATPIANMPEAVQTLTLANPLRYFMVVLRGVFLEGTPPRLLLDEFWPMALIGVITLTIATWLFRRRI